MADKQQNGQDKEKMTGAEAPERITIDTRRHPDPRLDPNSPEFDIGVWKAFVANNNSLDKVIEKLKLTTEKIAEAFTTLQALKPLLDELDELQPYLEAEFDKPEYDGLTMGDLIKGSTDADGNPVEGSLLNKALTAARKDKAEKERQHIIDTQKSGRQQRRQIKQIAEQQGAIMTLHHDSLPVFSERTLWDAFAPGRISKMGTLSMDAINEETGMVEPYKLQEQGAIIPLNATSISYKTFMLLNAITANSVENYRKYFIEDGTITFYVKGVLDNLEIDPRIKNDMQLNFERKTAGVLYLEKQFEPLLTFIGTTPDGSRYSVLSYDGYDVESDTMTIRTPYLFQLWKSTQEKYKKRTSAKKAAIEAGKKPKKSDLKPLEINSLFKGLAFKEDDTVLEIAVYITNILLNAGKGAHKTEITFKNLIDNCPRLEEKLLEIGSLPNTEILPNGKKRNNTARYNTELRKIAKAYSLIIDPDKCDALHHFKFKKFMPTKTTGAGTVFIPPTKSTLDEKIRIEWDRISLEDE